MIAQITDITKVRPGRVSPAAISRNRALAAQFAGARPIGSRRNSGSAADYVASILPADLDGSVRVSSRYVPSQALAGDVYDYRWIDDDHHRLPLDVPDMVSRRR